MRLAVLTSLFGSHEPLRSLTERELAYKSEVDFIAYVDREYPTCEGWTQIISPVFSSDQVYGYRRSAKLPKILPQFVQPDYDAYLWIDSCQIPNINPQELYETYLKGHDLALFSHPYRDCLYEEAKVCANIPLDFPQTIQDQVNFYSQVNLPKNYGLYELACFMMTNNNTTKELSLIWWEQVCRYSSRDQISFPFSLFRIEKEVKISTMPGYVHHPEGNDIFEKVREPKLHRKH